MISIVNIIFPILLDFRLRHHRETVGFLANSSPLPRSEMDMDKANEKAEAAASAEEAAKNVTAKTESDEDVEELLP